MGIGASVAGAFFFELNLLSSRLNYLLQVIDPRDYKPTLTGTGVLVWPGPEYDTVGPNTLAKEQLSNGSWRTTEETRASRHLFIHFSAVISGFNG